MDPIQQNNLQYRMDKLEENLEKGFAELKALFIKEIDELKRSRPDKKEMLLENELVFKAMLKETDIRYASKETEYNVNKLIWSIIGLTFGIALLVFRSMV
jgi:hypothetical protein